MVQAVLTIFSMLECKALVTSLFVTYKTTIRLVRVIRMINQINSKDSSLFLTFLSRFSTTPRAISLISTRECTRWSSKFTKDMAFMHSTIFLHAFLILSSRSMTRGSNPTQIRTNVFTLRCW